MRVNITPLVAERHLDAAAALLAERQRRDRGREPLLPAAYEDPAACRGLIENELNGEGCRAVFAESGGSPAGFMIMSPLLLAPTNMIAGFFPARSCSIGYGGHAARDDVAFDAYREMYASLSAPFVERGIFDHIIYLAPKDAVVLDAFSSLGFGRALTAAIRGVDPLSDSGASVDVHVAAEEDAQVVFDLNEELTLHHARPPIFFPMLRETEAASHEFTASLLKDSVANPHLVAYEGGRPLGMNTFMPPFWISPLICPEKTIYLYQGVVSESARQGGVGKTILARGVAWAREQGFEHIALHFASANISGAKFWQDSGFRPVEHRLTRHIDERIAWANG